jgi:hypothetical protein
MVGIVQVGPRSFHAKAGQAHFGKDQQVDRTDIGQQRLDAKAIGDRIAPHGVVLKHSQAKNFHDPPVYESTFKDVTNIGRFLSRHIQLSPPGGS